VVIEDRPVPEATVARLPLYLRSLRGLADGGTDTVSSVRLAELAGVNAAKVRKDLSHLGSYGTRGVGYDVAHLVFEIERELGLNEDRSVVIVGIGNLGQALANYGGFNERGFPIKALVDADPSRTERTVRDLPVHHIDDLVDIVARHQISIGLICTPATAAQGVADRLVAAGVRSILNFAPVVLAVDDSVSIRKVDLALELQVLGFYHQLGGG